MRTSSYKIRKYDADSYRSSLSGSFIKDRGKLLLSDYVRELGTKSKLDTGYWRGIIGQGKGYYTK